MMNLRVSKRQKYGVSITQIQALFENGPRIAPDPKHSADEHRLIAVGKTSAGQPVFVAFTIGTKNKRRLIRPVMARYMHAREIAAYENEGPTALIFRSSNRQGLNSRRKTTRSTCACRSRCWQR